MCRCLQPAGGGNGPTQGLSAACRPTEGFTDIVCRTGAVASLLRCVCALTVPGEFCHLPVFSAGSAPSAGSLPAFGASAQPGCPRSPPARPPACVSCGARRRPSPSGAPGPFGRNRRRRDEGRHCLAVSPEPGVWGNRGIQTPGAGVKLVAFPCKGPVYTHPWHRRRLPLTGCQRGFSRKGSRCRTASCEACLTTAAPLKLKATPVCGMPARGSRWLSLRLKTHRKRSRQAPPAGPALSRALSGAGTHAWAWDRTAGACPCQAE